MLSFLLFNFGHLLRNLHPLHSLLIPIDFASFLLRTYRSHQAIMSQLRLKGTLLQHLSLLFLFFYLFLHLSHLVLVSLVQPVNNIVCQRLFFQTFLLMLTLCLRGLVGQIFGIFLCSCLSCPKVFLNLCIFFFEKVFAKKLSFKNLLLIVFFPFLLLDGSIVLIIMKQRPPSLNELKDSLLISINFVQAPCKLSWKLLIQQNNDFLDFSGLYLFLIDHLPKTIHKPCLIFESAILQQSMFDFLLSGFDVFYDLKNLGCMKKRNAGFNVHN